jgi:hypothetical protein
VTTWIFRGMPYTLACLAYGRGKGHDGTSWEQRCQGLFNGLRMDFHSYFLEFSTRSHNVFFLCNHLFRVLAAVAAGVKSFCTGETTRNGSSNIQRVPGAWSWGLEHQWPLCERTLDCDLPAWMEVIGG